MILANKLEIFTPNESWNISPATLEKASQEAKQQSNAIACYNAYLNIVCLQTFLSWFQEWIKEENVPAPQVWPEENSLSSIWEVVNGTAISFGETRLVLIPSDEPDSEEFCVPQEWVDNPKWAADYYLAVEVSLDVDSDDCWIQVRGFATHLQLKNSARYDKNNFAYVFPVEELIESLVVMQITREMRVHQELSPMPCLSEEEARKLLRKLGDRAISSPRMALCTPCLGLDIPFAKWMALLVNNKWRQELYYRRTGKLMDLRLWLENLVQNGQNLIEENWQAFDTIFAQPELSPVRDRSVDDRSYQKIMVRDGSSDISSKKEIASVIRLTEPDRPEEIRCQAAGVLGEIGTGNTAAIAALNQLLQNTCSEETRWQAALSLGKIDPDNPHAGVRKARAIDLGMQFSEHAIALVIAIMPKDNGRLGVFLQVKPKNTNKLPPDLKLSVFSESGEKRMETFARSNEKGQGKDNYIQLRFNPPPNTKFQVMITLNDVSVTENFIT